MGIHLKLTVVFFFVFLFSVCANAQDLFTYKNELYQNNLREKVYVTLKGNEQDDTGHNSVDYNSMTAQMDGILEQVGGSFATDYKRSSLYTLMIADTLDWYYHTVKYVFGNSKLTEKFNDHNIGPYQILGKSGDINQVYNITDYLNNNEVAKQLVAKWFNRGRDGSFNMNLVARRGEYNASDLDIKIALQTARGKAMLKDAGEELIGNTFIIVYDFGKIYTERPKYSNTIKSKINITAHLYRLVWNNETASTFYNSYWMDEKGTESTRKTAFEKSDIFKLKYVGNVVTNENSKTSIYKAAKHGMKVSEKGFIDRDELGMNQYALAINNALNACFHDLQIKYPEFRTKFPLFSGDPISAKVGKKEGIKKGDEFEVLEREQQEDGTIEYRRMGIIKVGKEEDVWDNTTEGDWAAESATAEYTVFRGAKGKYGTGMFIRQIN
ncbi:MAG TPA: hypothetical protein VFM82_10810 [Flavobacteriaceae bacterium]|nr:hypothetical protein [Flavobacteriaceae bacterium]